MGNLACQLPLAFNGFSGFYLPQVYEGSLSVGNQREFAQATDRVITNTDEALSVFESVSAFSPTFSALEKSVREQGLDLVFRSQVPPMRLVDPHDPRIDLLVPNDRPVNSYFNNLLIQSGCVFCQPEGSDVNAFPSLGSQESILSEIWHKFYWERAIGYSFLFQVAHEFNVSGVQFIQPDGAPGMLSATEIAMFHYLRQGGLAEVVNKNPNYFSKDYLSWLNANFNSAAANMVSKADPVTQKAVWIPPQATEKPMLVRTYLDDLADKQIALDRGLHVKDLSVGLRMSKEELEEVNELLDRRIMGVEDLEYIFQAIAQLAPMLAVKILPEKGDMLFMQVKELDQQSGILRSAVMTMDFRTIFGLEECDNEANLFIRKGSSVRGCLLDVVMCFARFKMPILDMFGKIEFPEPTENEQADLDHYVAIIERRYHSLIAWGTTAAFEGVHQARLRGLADIRLNASYDDMQAFFDECGFAVFCDHWERFSDQRVNEVMRETALKPLARKILEEARG
ncbi:hypothetical protein KKF63_10680 [bacterium]|nr:hypothetical protein [bacterium]